VTPRRPSLETLLANAGWMRRLARRLARDEGEAEDLVQETWLAALRRGTEDEPPAGWLARVLRNLASKAERSRRHRRSREALVARPERLASTAELYERARLQRELASAVLELGEPYASTLLLRYFEDLPPRAIARRQGIAVSTVKTRLARGLERLRERLDREHGGREAWLPVLLPLLHTSGAAPSTIGALVMNAKNVLAGAAVLAAGLLFWLVATSFPRAGMPEPVAPHVATSAPLSRPTAESAGPERLAPPAEDRPVVESAAAAPDPPPEVPADEVLSGRVETRAGAPIAGAEVAASLCEGREYSVAGLDAVQALGRTRSGPEGEFRLRVPPGRPIDLEVRSAGFAPLTEPNRFGGEHVVLRLGEGARLFGRVLRSRDGSPVAGAFIQVRIGVLDEDGAPRFRETTDELGGYRIEDLPPGFARIDIEAANLELLREELELEEGQMLEREFSLAEGIVLEGTVLDAGTGQPIEGAEVDTPADPNWKYAARSGMDGRYVLRGVKLANLMKVRARASGYGLSTVALTRPRLGTPIDFELLPAKSATGRIVGPDGRPVADAFVGAVASTWFGATQRYESLGSRTGPDGVFELEGLAADLRHALFIRKVGLGTRVYDFPERESREERIDFGDIDLTEAGEIRARVVDETGAPRRVWAYLNGSNSDRFSLVDGPTWLGGSYVHTRELRTDANGRFRFTDVAAGDYELHVDIKGNAAPCDRTIRLSRGQILDLGDVMLPVGGTISGRVVDSEGRGLPSVVVDAWTAERQRREYTLTALDGSFLLRGLPEDDVLDLIASYGLVGESTRARFASCKMLQVPVGSRDLVLVLPRSALVTGRVLAPDGSPVSPCNVAVLEPGGMGTWGNFTGSDGDFSLKVAEGTRVDLWICPTNSELQPLRGWFDRVVIRDVLAGTRDLEIRLPQRP
jgi:RNA polymerase sigma factor (sigma-70 family)